MNLEKKTIYLEIFTVAIEVYLKRTISKFPHPVLRWDNYVG